MPSCLWHPLWPSLMGSGEFSDSNVRDAQEPVAQQQGCWSGPGCAQAGRKGHEGRRVGPLCPVCCCGCCYVIMGCVDVLNEHCGGWESFIQEEMMEPPCVSAWAGGGGCIADCRQGGAGLTWCIPSPDGCGAPGPGHSEVASGTGKHHTAASPAATNSTLKSLRSHPAPPPPGSLPRSSQPPETWSPSCRTQTEGWKAIYGREER